MAESFEKHARTVTLLTLVSRLTGLARDASLSRVFGAGPLMDAFWFAFLVPNLFRRLFGEGALSAAFIPVYAGLVRDDPRLARALATRVIGLLMVGLGVITLAGELLLVVIAGWTGQPVNPAVWLMMLMLPYMPLVCVVALLGAMLQVHGRFGPTAAAPVVLNLGIVSAAVGGWAIFRAAGDDSTMLRLALVGIAVVAAGAAQVIWSLWSLRGLGWWVRDEALRARARQPLNNVLSQAWPMMLGLGVLQVNTFLDGLIASYPTTVGPTIFGYDYPLAAGAMASVSYAQRLYEFPLGVFGIAAATAIFPALARATNDQSIFSDMLRRGLRLVVYIGLPASVGLMLVREPLTAVVFQGGDFTREDTHRVAFVLLGYAPAIWAYSMTHVLTRAFYARGDSRTPVKVALGIVGLNLALNVTLICTPLREAGLAWSTAICAMIQVVLLTRFVRRHSAAPIDRSVLAGWGRTIIISMVMAGAVWSADQWMMPTTTTWMGEAIRLAGLVTIGGVVVLAGSRILRMPELSWALGRATN